MEVKFKLLDNGILPTGNDGDAGVDLTAIGVEVVDVKDESYTWYYEYRTGVCVEIPEHHVGLLASRSSISDKNIVLANGLGIIDSTYRGELKMRFKPSDYDAFREGDEYQIGDRIGQLIIVPYIKIEPILADELTETKRGNGGFGSTGT